MVWHVSGVAGASGEEPLTMNIGDPDPAMDYQRNAAWTSDQIAEKPHIGHLVHPVTKLILM